MKPASLGVALILLYSLHHYDELHIVEAAGKTNSPEVAFATTTASSTVTDNAYVPPDFSKPLSYKVSATAHVETSDGAATLIPELVPVCACESAGVAWGTPIQFDANGNVVMNQKGTGDVGMCQINLRLHAATAKALGYDIFTRDGNIKFANWLFEQDGYRPWEASRTCWQHA